MSNALHLMWHYINTLLNQRLNVRFNMYNWDALFLHPFILMWSNFAPFFVFVLVTHVSWMRYSYNFVPCNFIDIIFLNGHKFCATNTSSSMQPLRNIQCVCSLIFKWFVPKLLSEQNGHLMKKKLIDNNSTNNMFQLQHCEMFYCSISFSSSTLGVRFHSPSFFFCWICFFFPFTLG